MVIRQEKIKTARLLRAKGKSLSKIADSLNIAKSTACLWCKDIQLSQEQRKNISRLNQGYKLGALANKIKRQKEITIIRQRSLKEIERLDKNDLERLKDIGTMLYWAEGTKKNVVDITNSDPELIRIAMFWLREICGVENNKFRASIFYHSGQDEIEIKKYWSKITKIPLEQFTKSIFKKEGTGHRKKILYYGTCKIRVNNKDLLCRILTWIEQFHIK